jgi:5-methylcytosine-specific restriction endonuclease McrA
MFSRETRIEILLKALGIDKDSFQEFLEWALCEQLVRQVCANKERASSFFTDKDGLRKFRDYLHYRTGRNWSTEDLDHLYDATRNVLSKHYREPITYGEYLRLLWTTEHKCAKCGKTPPEVMLHIDHIVPVVLGGRSERENLQFLCSAHNLQKSGKLETGRPWLNLR